MVEISEKYVGWGESRGDHLQYHPFPVWAPLLQQHLCLFVPLFFFFFVCLFVCSFVDLSVCLSICPCVSSQHVCPPSCCASAKLKQPKTTKHRVWNMEHENWNKEKGKFQCLFWLFDNRLVSALHGAHCHYISRN